MDSIIGEIRAFGTYRTPKDWLRCDGREYPINGLQALHAVIGTLYGGTPGKTFRVPNLSGRALLGMGAGDGLTRYPVTGIESGTPEVTLAIENMPPHQHRMLIDHGSMPRDQMHAVPAPGDVLLGSTEKRRFARDLGRTGEKGTLMAPDALGPAGQSAPLDNMQPFLALQFCICYEGEYPRPW